MSAPETQFLGELLNWCLNWAPVAIRNLVGNWYAQRRPEGSEMTRVATDTDRTARRMRRIARMLAVIFAVWWTLMWSAACWLVAAFAADFEAVHNPGHPAPPLEFPFWPWFLLIAVGWVSAAVVWFLAGRRRSKSPKISPGPE
jgi:hypothetical protein